MRSIESEASSLREELAVVDELIRQAISQNASMELNQADYQQRCEDAATRVATIEAECASRKAQQHSIDLFLNSLLTRLFRGSHPHSGTQRSTIQRLAMWDA